MSNVRKGDTIIDNRAREWWVDETSDGLSVHAVAATSGRSKTFPVCDLEGVDEGVWAYIPFRRPDTSEEGAGDAE